MRFSRLATLGVATWGMGMAPSRADAASITFAFVVQITSVTNLTADVPLIGGLASGETFSGTYTFDDGLVDSDVARPNSGTYNVVSSTAPFPLQLNLDGNAFGLGDTFQQVQPEFYFIQGLEQPGQGLPAGVTNPFFYLELDSSSIIYPTPDTLPVLPFPLASANVFNDSQFRFRWDGMNRVIGGNVISLQLVSDAPPSAVPEPASLMLVCSGVSAWIVRRRRAAG